MGTNSKITADHLRRRACLYIRQSSLHQVENNKESQVRQYGLRNRAVAMGWAEDQIDIIDEDQGRSGASAVHRSGFQDLKARVAAGEIGIILSLEVSRLCRDNLEWHQLLQIASISNTLILDEYGVYDVGDLNDWMLLGMKGHLSEYELRGIRARMIGGQRSKASRGELKVPLPIGFVYNESDQVDPDQSIRDAVALVFTTFQRLQSIMQVTKWFRQKEIYLPSRPRSGNRDLCWIIPNYSQIQRMIRNPRYAGCYTYGRSKTVEQADGTKRTVTLPTDQWMVCIPDAHPGYISWEEYQRNIETLKTNATSFLGDRVPSPRNGTALLQSRVICGVCGHRMRVTYGTRKEGPSRWYYICKENLVRRGTKTCQSIHGEALDDAIGDFVVDAVNQENIALTLMVREQLQSDFENADQQRMNHIQQLDHQVDLARRRYMNVDPSNRLVASRLEAEWNTQLDLYDKAVQEREKCAKAHSTMTETELDQHLLKLTHDFAKVWNAEQTSNEDRKRLLGFLIEDITLTRNGYQVDVGIRLRGGHRIQLDPIEVPRPRAVILRRDASPEALEELEILLEEGYPDDFVANELNQRGHRDSRGDVFTQRSICIIRSRHNMVNGIKRKREKLREQGYISGAELAVELGVPYSHLYKHVPNNPQVEVYEIPCTRRNSKMYKFTPKPKSTPSS